MLLEDQLKQAKKELEEKKQELYPKPAAKMTSTDSKQPASYGNYDALKKWKESKS